MSGGTDPAPTAVTVVGAGIAGLTLAAVLRRAGIPHRVLDQASRFGQVGAGIQLAPNAVRLLHRLGLARELAEVAARPQALQVRGWQDDRLLSATTLGAACEDAYGAPYYTVHRADLHSVLAGAAGGTGLSLRSRVTGVIERASQVELALADGSHERGGIVVGADGIHSVVREVVAADRPRFAGGAIFRGLVPAAQVPELAREPLIRMWAGPAQHCVCYPVAGGRAISFSATVPARQAGSESWSALGSATELVSAYRGWNPAVTRLLAAADGVGRWDLHDREPIPRWSTARVTLAGDAAHPMLPFMAQGGNQAIEDAVALGTCLAALGAGPAALRLYEALRVPRTALIQRGSRLGPASSGAPGPVTEPVQDGLQRLRAMGWLYGHDSGQAALAATARVRAALAG
ncbi:MAG TPA: FAD-dependent monooxygenase [Jatrophihabitans sp.]|nr:FAD-dependent monooxygenase [Jatrophihabitans sp.]